MWGVLLGSVVGGRIFDTLERKFFELFLVRFYVVLVLGNFFGFDVRAERGKYIQSKYYILVPLLPILV
jgi:hypothetical protein